MDFKDPLVVKGKKKAPVSEPIADGEFDPAQVEADLADLFRSMEEKVKAKKAAKMKAKKDEI